MKRTSVTKQNSVSSTSENNHIESVPLVRTYRVSDVSAVEISDLILPVNHALEDITIPDHEYLGSTESIIRKKSTHLGVDTPVSVRKKRRKVSSKKAAAEINFEPTTESKSDTEAMIGQAESEAQPEQKKGLRVKFEPLSPKMTVAKKRWIAL